jgi:hypothetical protein
LLILHREGCAIVGPRPGNGCRSRCATLCDRCWWQCCY